MYSSSEFRSFYFIIAGYFYLGQGYSLGSLVLLLPLYISGVLGQTYTVAVITSTIIIIPWYFKFIFGMISDNWPINPFGRRRPYLVIATLFSIYGWLTIDRFKVLGLPFILSGFFLALGSALADSVIDGQIVEITPPKLASRTQGIAWGSRGLGLGMAAYVAPQLVEFYSWHQMFIISAIFGISISIITLLLPQVPIVGMNSMKYMFRQLKDYSRKQENKVKFRLLFMLFTGSSLSFVPMFSLIMEREFGFDYSTISTGSLIFAIGALIGSFSTGFLIERRDDIRSFNTITILMLCVIAIGFLPQLRVNFIAQLAYLFLIGSISSSYETYQLKTIQESSIARYEGTSFSIYTSFSNVGQFIFGSWVLVLLAETYQLGILQTYILLLVPLIGARYALTQFYTPKP